MIKYSGQFCKEVVKMKIYLLHADFMYKAFYGVPLLMIKKHLIDNNNEVSAM